MVEETLALPCLQQSLYDCTKCQDFKRLSTQTYTGQTHYIQSQMLNSLSLAGKKKGSLAHFCPLLYNQHWRPGLGTTVQSGEVTKGQMCLEWLGRFVFGDKIGKKYWLVSDVWY